MINGGQATDYLVITTTADNRDLLAQIAKRLVQERVAACCQIFGPHTSYYRWEGKIEESTEWMCLIKTVADKYSQVEATIRQMHGYQTPEIIATPITRGSKDYLDWIQLELEEN